MSHNPTSMNRRELQAYVAELLRGHDLLCARIERLERVASESYQVVGALADKAGVFDTDDVNAALDNLCAAAEGEEIPHETVLPFWMHPKENPAG